MEPRTIVWTVIGILLVAALVPGALESLFEVDTSAWPTMVATLWEFLPVIVIIVLVLYFMGDRLLATATGRRRRR